MAYTIVRLHVAVEDADVLIADFAQALDTACRPERPTAITGSPFHDGEGGVVPEVTT
ncbi:hypothetical protein [Streptomyces sp. NBC_00280]|uniref:hypothetical protein n=1 Tax=Streptomyces sp. NBC_00280 TaxID=2975699 RepID=UPI0032483860